MVYGRNIRLKTVPSESDVYLDMALTMLECIIKNNKEGKNTVMIVPVGPTGQYPVLAELANRLRISLRKVYFFNMDEYLIKPGEAIPGTHPMSFFGRMKKDFYDRVDPELAMPETSRFFPVPGREAEFDGTIESLGGADICLGGLGINGHIAFNEPPEADEMITTEEFSRLPTRVLRVTRETRAVNAIGYQRGDITGMPEWCITIGMKQILASKKVYIALTREWQHGIAKRMLTGAASAAVPASLLQDHPDVCIVSPESIAKGLE